MTPAYLQDPCFLARRENVESHEGVWRYVARINSYVVRSACSLPPFLLNAASTSSIIRCRLTVNVLFDTAAPMGVSRRRCFKCNKSSSEVTARCVPYYKTADFGDGTRHISSTTPSLCDNCGKEEIISGDERVIGMLTSSYAEQYEAAAARSMRHMDDLIFDGLTVINDRQLMVLMQNLAEGQLWPCMFSAEENKSHPLKHNNRSDPKTTTEIGTDKEEKESSSDHPARRWSNLFRLDEHGGDSTLNNQMLQLETLLGRIFFPHEYYASMAVSYGEGWNGEMSEWEGRKNEINDMYQRPLLKVQDVNALIKGPSLDEAQSPHVDGYGLKLVVIFVDTCSGDGYEFRYIKGSHALLREHEDYAKRTRLPMKDMTTVRVGEGDCIVFWESVVHAGGAASTRNPLVGKAAERANERYTRLGSDGFKFFGGNDTTTLPSDLSLQVTLQYAGCPSGSNIPNRTNTWYKSTDQLFDLECCPACDELLHPLDVVWGRCNHAIHQSCLSDLDDDQICPACKSRKKWELDCSADKYMDVINQLKNDRTVEKLLNKAREQVIARICNPEMKILPKRKRRP